MQKMKREWVAKNNMLNIQIYLILMEFKLDLKIVKTTLLIDKR